MFLGSEKHFPFWGLEGNAEGRQRRKRGSRVGEQEEGEGVGVREESQEYCGCEPVSRELCDLLVVYLLQMCVYLSIPTRNAVVT